MQPLEQLVRLSGQVHSQAIDLLLSHNDHVPHSVANDQVNGTTNGEMNGSTNGHIKGSVNDGNHGHRSTTLKTYQSLLPNDTSAELPADLRRAQTEILDLTARIQQLLTTPGDFLIKQGVQLQQLACLRWLAYFSIFSHVPRSGDAAPYTTIAKTVGVPVSQLKSVSRMAMTCGLFSEPLPEHISHSPLSSAFAEDPSLCPWALFVANETQAAASHFAEATEKFGETSSKIETSYCLAKKMDKPFFDYLKEEPERGKTFAAYMKNITNTYATSMRHAINAYDWGSLRDGARVVDVGGSSGTGAYTLAEAYPQLNITVQDLQETLESSSSLADSYPSTVTSRVDFQAHDFFTPQPIKDADVYFMRTVIHDWPAEEARKILSHLAAALKERKNDARIVVMDIVLPRPGSEPTHKEAAARLRDLTMIQIFNAKEREMKDWEELSASAGLKIVKVRRPLGSSLSVLEMALADAI